MGEKEKHLGYITEFTVKKNKVARPGGHCEVPYFFDGGFEKTGDVVAMALEKEILHRVGNSIHYGEQKLGGGKDAASEFVDSDPELKATLVSLLFPIPQK